VYQVGINKGIINSNVFYVHFLIWSLSRLLCCVGSGSNLAVALDSAATGIGRNPVPVFDTHHVVTLMDEWLWSCTVPHGLNFGCKCRRVLCSSLQTFGHFRYSIVGRLRRLQCQTDWLTYGFVPLPEIEYQIPDRRASNLVSCLYVQYFIIFLCFFYIYGVTVEKPVKNKRIVNCLDVWYI